MNNFIHLHVHSHYSAFDAISQIPSLVDKALSDGMTAMALTDHGNMFGVREFFDYAARISKDTGKPFKPIIGCEVYVSPTTRFINKGKGIFKDYHLVLLAKNKIGYHNLIKLVSLGYIEGFYDIPRIDRELLERCREGLIVLSSCLAGEISQHILDGNLAAARASVLWFKERLGDDFYIELQRHKTRKANDVFKQQKKVNAVLMELSEQHGVKCVATNDVHFVNKRDAYAHECFLRYGCGFDCRKTSHNPECIRIGCVGCMKTLHTPECIRFSKQEWFKTRAEMSAVFSDLPQALENTNEIADKVEFYDINRPPIKSFFPLPEGFDNADSYLEHLVFLGAQTRYGSSLDENIRKRIYFELETIKKLSIADYFLLVWEMITAMREMGSLASIFGRCTPGSVAAYCLRISNLDPIKYNLLFQNDRAPNINIELDCDEHEKQIQWLSKRYNLAGTVSFHRLSPNMANSIVWDAQTGSDSYSTAQLDNIEKSVKTLEGVMYETEMHCHAIAMAPDDVTNYVPVYVVRDKKTNSQTLVTQYPAREDWEMIEDAGLIKLNLLGMNNLSIIKKTLATIKRSHGIDIDIYNIPLDDAPTFDLLCNGDVTDINIFPKVENGKKLLRELHPDNFNDLIAFYVLFRPPIYDDILPEFIARRLGNKPIEYTHPIMERRLKETCGIIVYQEQLMLLSQDFAGFTPAESNEFHNMIFRKGLITKSKANCLMKKFITGCKNNGFDEKTSKTILNDMISKTYALCKAISGSYVLIGYQMAYLKANFNINYK